MKKTSRSTSEPGVLLQNLLLYITIYCNYLLKAFKEGKGAIRLHSLPLTTVTKRWHTFPCSMHRSQHWFPPPSGSSVLTTYELQIQEEPCKGVPAGHCRGRGQPPVGPHSQTSNAVGCILALS